MLYPRSDSSSSSSGKSQQDLLAPAVSSAVPPELELCEFWPVAQTIRDSSRTLGTRAAPGQAQGLEIAADLQRLARSCN